MTSFKIPTWFYDVLVFHNKCYKILFMYKRKGIALKKKRKSLMYKHKIQKFFFYEAKEFSCFKKSLKIIFLAWVISMQS